MMRMRSVRRRLVLTLVGLLVVGVVGLYLWYVRGVGIRPQIGESPGFRWELRAHMPKARTEVAVAAWSGRIYVIGGFDGFARTTSTVQVYDPTTDTWTMGPPLPRGVHHAMAAAIGDRLYLVGGFSGVRFAPSHRVFAFDGSTWREVTPLPEPLGASGIAVLDGRIHVVSGQGRAGNVRSHYVYDPGRNVWGRLAELEVARDHLALAALDGKLYAIGGRRGGKISRNLAVVEVYDPRTDAWSAAPRLVNARSGHTAAVLAGRICVFGGEEPRATIRPVEVFDGRSWSVATSLPTPRHGLGSAVHVDAIFVLSGGKRPALSVSGTNEALTIVGQPR